MPRAPAHRASGKLAQRAECCCRPGLPNLIRIPGGPKAQCRRECGFSLRKRNLKLSEPEGSGACSASRQPSLTSLRRRPAACAGVSGGASPVRQLRRRARRAPRPSLAGTLCGTTPRELPRRPRAPTGQPRSGLEAEPYLPGPRLPLRPRACGRSAAGGGLGGRRSGGWLRRAIGQRPAPSGSACGAASQADGKAVYPAAAAAYSATGASKSQPLPISNPTAVSALPQQHQ